MLQDPDLGKRQDIWAKLYCPQNFSGLRFILPHKKHQYFRNDWVRHGKKG